MIAIKTKNLTKHFSRTSGYLDLLPFRKREMVRAVENVCMDIEGGELFGLLGPNGAGKTTFIKMLCCLVLPTSGAAQIFGYDIIGSEQKVKQIVGLVSAEERSFYWRLTGRENLRFFASLYRIPNKQAINRIEELLHLVDMRDKADIRFQNYSTGMRQKLAIARGLLSEPRILFVDEPTRSLDPVSAQAIRDFLKEKVVAEGRTVILATHNLREAEQLCNRLAILDHGRVKALGSIQELRSLLLTREKCELKLRNFSDKIVSQLRHIEGVLDCNVVGHQNGVADLEIMISKRSSVLPIILQTIINSNIEVCDCQLGELPLDEIFIRALRDDSQAEDS